MMTLLLLELLLLFRRCSRSEIDDEEKMRPLLLKDVDEKRSKKRNQI